MIYRDHDFTFEFIMTCALTSKRCRFAILRFLVCNFTNYIIKLYLAAQHIFVKSTVTIGDLFVSVHNFSTRKFDKWRLTTCLVFFDAKHY